MACGITSNMSSNLTERFNTKVARQQIQNMTVGYNYQEEIKTKYIFSNHKSTKSAWKWKLKLNLNSSSNKFHQTLAELSRARIILNLQVCSLLELIAFFLALPSICDRERCSRPMKINERRKMRECYKIEKVALRNPSPHILSHDCF